MSINFESSIDFRSAEPSVGTERQSQTGNVTVEGFARLYGSLFKGTSPQRSQPSVRIAGEGLP